MRLNCQSGLLSRRRCRPEAPWCQVRRVTRTAPAPARLCSASLVPATARPPKAWSVREWAGEGLRGPCAAPDRARARARRHGRAGLRSLSACDKLLFQALHFVPRCFSRSVYRARLVLAKTLEEGSVLSIFQTRKPPHGSEANAQGLSETAVGSRWNPGSLVLPDKKPSAA